jgi:hypothetical protein
MYLHLGNEVSIRTRDLIGIFDLDTVTLSKDTKDFLRRCEDEDIVTNVSSDLPKSFVLCRYNGAIQVFISAISSVTLKKRTSYLSGGVGDAGGASGVDDVGGAGDANGVGDADGVSSAGDTNGMS